MRRSLALSVAAGLALAACSGGSGVVADAGTDFTVAVGEAPVFDGCGSSGDINNYEWTIVTAPTEEDGGKALRTEMGDCDFLLESTMVIDDVGEWTIELSVTDGEDQATDQVVVTVTE